MFIESLWISEAVATNCSIICSCSERDQVTAVTAAPAAGSWWWYLNFYVGSWKCFYECWVVRSWNSWNKTLQVQCRTVENSQSNIYFYSELADFVVWHCAHVNTKIFLNFSHNISSSRKLTKLAKTCFPLLYEFPLIIFIVHKCIDHTCIHKCNLFLL